MLETPEHWEINKANTLEQLYSKKTLIFYMEFSHNFPDNLQALHKRCRNKELVINKRYEELSKMTAIIDPDKFPIFSLLYNSFKIERLISFLGKELKIMTWSVFGNTSLNYSKKPERILGSLLT